MADVTMDWDPGGIVVVPGLPGSLSQPDDGRPTYPATTLLTVKTLRSEGYQVTIATPEDVREVQHFASDLWLPVMHIGYELLIGTGGGLLAELVLHLLGKFGKKKVVAHIKWQVREPNGRIATLEADGDADAVVAAARSFENSLDLGE